MKKILYGVAAILNISSRVINFIFDELSLEEIQSRERLRQECERRGKQFSKDLSSASEKYNKELKKELNDISELGDITDYSSLISDLKKAVLERIKEQEEKKEEIKDALDNVKKVKKDNCSAMRRSALEMLESELYDAYNRVGAYIIYLRKYYKKIEEICKKNQGAEICFEFSMRQIPYKGGIFYLKNDAFDHKSGVGKIVLHNVIEYSFVIDDIDYYSTRPERKGIPVCMNSYDSNTYLTHFSMQLGEYFELCRYGYSGIPAVVKSYKDRYTVGLTYGNSLELILKGNHLVDIDRFPPIKSSITVYPIGKVYDRKSSQWILSVSQREEDQKGALWFDKIPIIIPEKKRVDFINEYVKRNLSAEADDVKIAPYCEEDIPDNIEKIKIQFDESYTILVRIKSGKELKLYLEFDSFIQDKDQEISPEDIFVPFSAELHTLLEEEYYDVDDKMAIEYADCMNNLVITIFTEFKLQKMIKLSGDGLKYFSTWEKVTSQLKYYHEKGETITLSTIGIPDKQNNRLKLGTCLKYKIQNKTECDEYRNRCMDQKEDSHYEMCFFTEHNGIRYMAKFANMKEYDIEIMVPFVDIKGKFKENEEVVEQMELISELVIYRKQNPIPERRQLFALHEFKIGKLANPYLQACLLNGKNITSEKLEDKAIVLQNELLGGDKSQYEALRACMNEKNIFLIQGPPGTGKTTVIRELIWQTQLDKKNAKILIVSQANVAVDNVIKGIFKIQEFDKKEIIRCGRDDRMQAEIQEVSFGNKYNQYISGLNTKTSGEGVVAELSKMWLHMLTASDTGSFNAEIGGLLLKSHKLVGATCIGLGQKQIGMEGITFDLVIIDEAGKALAPEIILPITKAKKVIIIGDHLQLPPVVDPAIYDPEKIELNDKEYCKKELFEVSFFEKLYKACPDSSKIMLRTQYRMPALIGSLISEIFYGSMVENADVTHNKQPLYFNRVLNFLDMSHAHLYCEDDRGGSPVNEFEADYVCKLILAIRNKNTESKIAIITPYKGQKRNIEAYIAQNAVIANDNLVICDTVDSYQGDEAEIVIFCMTRAKKRTFFLTDSRRLNVAVSRTKNEFIMIGSRKFIESNFSPNDSIVKVFDYIKKNGAIRDYRCLESRIGIKNVLESRRRKLYGNKNG